MVLSGMVGSLATVAARAGLYGPDIYRPDTLFFAAGFRGQDAVTLFMGVPLLLAAVIAASTYNQVSAGIPFRRGEIAGPIAGFLLLGAAGVG
jgi:hypothetical protein